MEGLQAELPQEAAQASAWIADSGRHLCPFGDDAIGLGLRENPGASVNEPSNCAGIRERRYWRLGFPARGLLTVPDSGEKKPFLPCYARESRSVGTDGRRFPRSAAPALPTVPVSGAAQRSLYRRSPIPAPTHDTPSPRKTTQTHRWRIGRPLSPAGAL